VRHRLRTALFSALAAVVVAPLLGAAPSGGDHITTRVAPIEKVVQAKVVPPDQARRNSTSAVQQPEVPPERDTPWNKEECRAALGDVPRGEVWIAGNSRFSECVTTRRRYELYESGVFTAYADYRATIIQDTHRTNLKASSHVLLDDFKLVVLNGNPQTRKKLEDSDLTVYIECIGAKGAECNGKVKDQVLDGRDISTWRTEPNNDLFAEFDMTNSPVSDPEQEPRAKNYLRGDKISWHNINQIFIGSEPQDPDEEKEIQLPIRCDRAFYVRQPGGCIWDSNKLIWWVDYKDWPEYAKHVWDAQQHPTTTDPFGNFPNVKIPGSPIERPNPADMKPLTRLHKSADGNRSLDYYNDNEQVRKDACDQITKPADTECDEYPLHTNYEGAYYSQLYPSDKWKYSVRYIDADDNWNAGIEWGSWLAQQRVLAKGDELWISPFNIPTAEKRLGAAVIGNSKPAIAFLSKAERAADPIPDSELCSHPVHGGRYSCDYGEEWYKFPNGVRQAWVIGSDRQIWTRWSKADGTFTDWQPFGGVATSGVEFLEDESDGMGAVVRVRGTDGKPWYRERNPDTGVWTDWHKR
jgi:hypothetical protein